MGEGTFSADTFSMVMHSKRYWKDTQISDGGTSSGMFSKFKIALVAMTNDEGFKALQEIFSEIKDQVEKTLTTV